MNDSTHGRPGRLAAAIQVAAVMLIVGGFAVVGVSFAFSATPTSQTAPAVITLPDAKTSLNQGGSATPFTIMLPANSHCTGDTHTDGFLVWSYITSANPSTLTFSLGNASGGPSSGFPLFETLVEGQNSYGATATAISTGNIAQTPTLDFSLFSATATSTTATLPVGTYNVGIACATQTGALDQFWNASVAFTASTSDPNGEVWAVAGSTGTTTTTSTTTGSGGGATTTTTAAGGGGTTTTTTATGGGGTTTTTTTGTGGAGTTTTSTTGTTTTTTVVTGTSATALAATGSQVITTSDWGIAMVLLGLAAVVGTRRRWRYGEP